MSEQKTNRTNSGGHITMKPVCYGTHTLPPERMDEVAQELQDWALRALPPQQKFARSMIDRVIEVISVYQDDPPPEEGLPLLEEFLMALRGPYGREHVTMPKRKLWAQDVMDFIYTLVADGEYQRVLREQFNSEA
jgi:hypothetical protein